MVATTTTVSTRGYHMLRRQLTIHDNTKPKPLPPPVQPKDQPKESKVEHHKDDNRGGTVHPHEESVNAVPKQVEGSMIDGIDDSKKVNEDSNSVVVSSMNGGSDEVPIINPTDHDSAAIMTTTEATSSSSSSTTTTSSSSSTTTATATATTAAASTTTSTTPVAGIMNNDAPEESGSNDIGNASSSSSSLSAFRPQSTPSNVTVGLAFALGAVAIGGAMMAARRSGPGQSARVISVAAAAHPLKSSVKKRMDFFSRLLNKNRESGRNRDDFAASLNAAHEENKYALFQGYD